MKNINRTKQQYMSIPKIPTVANNNHKQTDRQNTHAHPRTNTQTNSSTPTPPPEFLFTRNSHGLRIFLDVQIFLGLYETRGHRINIF